MENYEFEDALKEWARLSRIKQLHAEVLEVPTKKTEN